MRWIIFATLIPACFSPNIQEGAQCSEDGQCPEGQECSVDNRCFSSGMEPDQPDGSAGPICDEGAVTCSNGERRSCVNGAERVEQCVLGCADSEDCVDVDPSNDLEADLDMAYEGADVELTNNAFFNTDTGVVRNGDGTLINVGYRLVEAQENGVPLGVFHFRSLRMENIEVVGTAALALVVANEVELNGTVDLSATGGPAPGAGITPCAPSSGQRQPGATAFASGGADGGGIRGFGTVFGQGGGGGCVMVDGSCELNQAGTGNTPAIPENLVPLAGGCNGGARDGSDREGGGGGAVQIVSNLEIRFGPSGTIVAGGAGGFRDDGPDSNGLTGSGGAGGGSGGAVLLEAPNVILLEGTGIAANGGGGGSYAGPGVDATMLTTNPAAGHAGNTFKGEGGNGATQTVEAGRGGDRESGSLNGDPDTAAAGGGGGGGLGRVRINIVGGIFDLPAGVILSPEPTVGTLVAQ